MAHRTPMHMTDYFSYDSYGNQTSARRVNYATFSSGAAENANPYIRTENTYTSDGNYTATTKDARGNVVTQSVNAKDGTLTSVTDPENQTVNYTYDASKRVTAVQTTGDGKTYRNGYTYENDRIKTVSHNTTSDTSNDVTYTFDYDALGRKTTVKVGSQVLSTNVYENDRSGLLSEVQYGNGGKVKYAYDDFDRMTSVKYDAEITPRYEYKYGANGEVAEVEDNNLNRTARTDYDQAERPCQTELRDNATGEALYKTWLKYDKYNNLVQFAEKAGGESHTSDYSYDRDNRVNQIAFDGGTHKVGYTYDALGRIASRSAENGTTAGMLTSNYTYMDGGYGTNSTTPLVKTISQPEICFDYAYDNRGNIISEKRYAPGTSEESKQETTYAYDVLGQLVRVNDPHDKSASENGTTWVFNYDRGGNITSKICYAYTTGTLGTAVDTIQYAYDDANWKDKLTDYNGRTFSYDAIGNLTSDGIWSYEWSAGRRLKRMSAEGGTLTFKYGHDGLRTQKVFEGSWYPETTNYTLHGKLITHMTVDYVDWDEAERQDVLHFFYDAQSRPAKVKFNGDVFTYVHNLQGDVVGILDETGELVVEYKYDAWGKKLSTSGALADTLGKRNPFRYRGYVYDEESGLYYLRSRYYNQEWGRFVNGDAIVKTNFNTTSKNIFAYCQNRPILLTDSNGYFEMPIVHDIPKPKVYVRNPDPTNPRSLPRIYHYNDVSEKAHTNVRKTINIALIFIPWGKALKAVGGAAKGLKVVRAATNNKAVKAVVNLAKAHPKATERIADIGGKGIAATQEASDVSVGSIVADIFVGKDSWVSEDWNPYSPYLDEDNYCVIYECEVPNIQPTPSRGEIPALDTFG